MADGGHLRGLAIDGGYSFEEDINTFFVVWAATLVVLMQVAFALLEVAHVSPKNSRTVILKNALDNAFGAAAWFLTGYALSGGAAGFGTGRFVGTAWATSVDTWAAVDPPHGSPPGAAHADTTWVFYFSFASSAATIVSGATAERTRLVAHLAFSAIMCGLIYPVAHYWLWGNKGWLNSTADGGVLTVNAVDVAGSGVVHVLGGVAALVGAYIAGPRIKTPVTADPEDTSFVLLHSERSNIGGSAADRPAAGAAADHMPNPASDHSLKATGLLCLGGGGPGAGGGGPGELPEAVVASAGRPASRTFLALSAFIMWYSFYGFNLGALGGIVGRVAAAGRVMMVTTIGGMCGAVTSAMLGAYVQRWELSISNVCNGLISGLVATAACCAVIPPWTAFFIGTAAATAFMAMSHSLPWLGIDDPVNAGPTHFCGGAVGLLAVGLVAARQPLEDFLQRGARDVGLLYGGNGRLLGAQVLALVTLTAWAAATSALVFLVLRRAGLLRQPLEVEVLGIDARVFESKQHKSGMALSVLQQARASQQRCHAPHLTRRRSNADSSLRSNASSHSGSFRGNSSHPARPSSPPLTARSPPPSSLPPLGTVPPELSFLPNMLRAASRGDPYAAAAARDAATSLRRSSSAAQHSASRPDADATALPGATADAVRDASAPRESTMRRSQSVSMLGGAPAALASSLNGAVSGGREAVAQAGAEIALGGTPAAANDRRGAPEVSGGQISPLRAVAVHASSLPTSSVPVPAGPPAITSRRFATLSGLSTGIVRAGSHPGLASAPSAISPGGPLGPLSARIPEPESRPAAGALSALFECAAQDRMADGHRRVASTGAVTVLSLDRGEGGRWFSCGCSSDASRDSGQDGMAAAAALQPMIVSRVYVSGKDPAPRRLPNSAVARDHSRRGGEGSTECDGIDTNASELSFRRFAHGTSPPNGSSHGSSCGLSLGGDASSHGTGHRGLTFVPTPLAAQAAAHALSPAILDTAPPAPPGPAAAPVLQPHAAASSRPSSSAASDTGELPADPEGADWSRPQGADVESGRSHSSGTLSTHFSAWPTFAAPGTGVKVNGDRDPARRWSGSDSGALPQDGSPTPAGATNGQATNGHAKNGDTSAAMSNRSSEEEIRCMPRPAAESISIPRRAGPKVAMHAPHAMSVGHLLHPMSEPLLPEHSGGRGIVTQSSSADYASGPLSAFASLSSVDVRTHAASPRSAAASPIAIQPGGLLAAAAAADGDGGPPLQDVCIVGPPAEGGRCDVSSLAAHSP